MAERGRNKKRGPLSKEAKARQKQRRKEEIQQLKNIGVGALETFTPLGDVQTAKDASKAFQEGRYFESTGDWRRDKEIIAEKEAKGWTS